MRHFLAMAALLLCSFANAQTQVPTTISALPAPAIPLTGAEVLPCDQAGPGDTHACTVAEIQANAGNITRGTISCSVLPSFTGAFTTSGCAASFASAANNTALANVSGSSGGAVATPLPLTGNTFNVLNYGDALTCTGAEDDTAALNAATTAAKAYAAYTPQYGVVIVAGPAVDASHPYCTTGSAGTTHGVNATGFNVWNTAGNGQSPGKLILRDLNLYCVDPSFLGIDCIDISNSLNVTIDRTVSIHGDAVHPPLRGIAQMNIAGVTAPCCIDDLDAQVWGSFVFANYYNMGGESTTASMMLSQGEVARGALDSLSLYTTGSGGNPGTYACVPFTGGSGYGFTGTAVVNLAGQLASVTPCNNGIGYYISDQLSTTAGGLTGAAIMPAALVNWAMVIDGQNHWHACSYYAGCNNSVDSQVSMTQFIYRGHSIRSSLSALWLGATVSAIFDGTYFNAEGANALPCVYLFDNGVAQNINTTFTRYRCEASHPVGDFRITGGNTGPAIESFTAVVDFEKGNNIMSPNMFNLDPAYTWGTNGGVSLNNARIDWRTADKIPMFDNAVAYTVSGYVNTWIKQNWNAPYNDSTIKCLGEFSASQISSRCSPPGVAYASAELTGSLASATNGLVAIGSCSHVVYPGWTGPLCNVQRTSDNATFDLFPDAYGNLDRAAASAICSNTTCGVDEIYDQAGNGCNAVQAVQADQPPLTLNNVNMNGRATVTVQTGTAQALAITCTAANDVFGSVGGEAFFVLNRASTGATGGRVFSKTDGATVGAELFTVGTGVDTLEFTQQASTSAGVWQTSTTFGGSLPYVVDVQYYNGSLANTPAIVVSGTAVTLGTSTAPTGTISSDAAQSLVIGNNAAGSHSLAADIGEYWFFKSTAAHTTVASEAARRAAASYFNITYPVVH